MNLDFKYFNSTADETSIETELPFELKNDPAKYTLSCKFCGRTDECMPLDKSTYRKGHDRIIELDSPYREGSGIYTTYACIDCLRKREYEFRHNTEVGELREAGFMKFNYETKQYEFIDPQPSISKVAMEELRITPPFRAYQGASWLLHCNDFMTYLGVWDDDDFEKYSSDGNMFSFFLKTVGEQVCSDYGIDAATGTEEDLYELFHGEYSEITCYAFKCIHCHVYRIGTDNS